MSLPLLLKNYRLLIQLVPIRYSNQANDSNLQNYSSMSRCSKIKYTLHLNINTVK